MRENKALFIIGIVFASIGGLFAAGAAALLVLSIAFYIALPFLIVGVIFAVLGTVFLITGRPRDKHKLWLINNGRHIQAEITDIQKNTAYSVNGKNPYTAVCRYEQNGIFYLFKSDFLWVYPELSGNTVSVYVNPNNIKDYYVSLDSLLKPVVEL